MSRAERSPLTREECAALNQRAWAKLEERLESRSEAEASSIAGAVHYALSAFGVGAPIAHIAATLGGFAGKGKTLKDAMHSEDAEVSRTAAFLNECMVIRHVAASAADALNTGELDPDLKLHPPETYRRLEAEGRALAAKQRLGQGFVRRTVGGLGPELSTVVWPLYPDASPHFHSPSGVSCVSSRRVSSYF